MKVFGARFPHVIGILLLIAAAASTVLPSTALAAGHVEREVAVPSPEDFGCVRVVRPGETMFSIAFSQGTSPFTLQFVNGISDFDFIFPGFVLRVPCVFPVPSVQFPQPLFRVAPAANVCNVHIVQRGEWLSMIAARFGVTWQSIAAKNGLLNPNIIFPGMRLLIPCSPISQINPQIPQQPTPTPTRGAAAVTASMMNIMFHPARINIRVGQSVMWHNMDSVQHSATEGTCSTSLCTPAAGGFDTGILNPGQISAPITFNSLGTFHFFCRIHGPMMQGDVVVTP